MVSTRSVIAKAFLALLVVLVLQVTGTTVHVAKAANTIRVPGDYPSIQAAVTAAAPGDTIKVSEGTFSENVLISRKSDIRLIGDETVLEGSDVSGMGIGIHVLDSQNVRIKDFVVRGFEAGIVLEGTHHSKVRDIETFNHFSDVASLRDGIQLVASNYNTISDVEAYGNGHNGVTLKGGSSNNVLKDITSNDNGLQVTANAGGCGIQLISSGNHNNVIKDSETERNGWGIQVGGGSNGNKVKDNESSENLRAGIAVLALATGNKIVENEAEGNGLANLSPSFEVDLFDQGVLDNTWKENEGTANF